MLAEGGVGGGLGGGLGGRVEGGLAATPAGGLGAWPLVGLAGALLAAAAVSTIAVTLLASVSFGTGSTQGALGGGAPASIPNVPTRYLALYLAAARRYGLDWTVLAAIGEVECDHGRDPDPSCTKEGVVNSAGAGGPAQFLASTWHLYGVDGDGNGTADRWNPADAIFSMAHYLRASGAPADYRTAIFTYNHAAWYVAEVERWAAVYRTRAAQQEAASESQATQAAADVRWTAGTQAVLSPGDGHLALVPMQAPPAVQAMVIAGNELQDLPYGPDGHPDPRGALDEDCSSTLNYVLYRSGVRPIAEILRENPLAQDYVRWGAPGPGKWVTIYATAMPTAHVFVVIAGLRLDTSHDGTDVGPNRYEDGPRWRVLDHMPGWAHWSVRHPPGL